MCLENINATQQVPDILLHDNKEVEIYVFPLEDVWDKVLIDTSYIIQTCMSTACYRLYQASWEITDNKLYLDKVSDFCNPAIRANLDLIFGEKVQNKKVFSDWFTGRIEIPKGKVIYYEFYSGREVYEEETLIYFEKGVITKIKEVTNLNSRLKYYGNNNFSRYILSQLDEKIRKEIWKKKFKLNFYIDVECDKKQKMIDFEYTSVYAIRYKNKIEKIILKINDWDIFYEHGERISGNGSYNVRIDKKFMKKNREYWN